MLGKNFLRKSITSMTAVAVWCVYSMVAFAVPTMSAGEITVVGQVTVNGQQAVSNSTIVSGAVITTGERSTASINLGKAGRVELLENSSMTLRFDDASITASLSDGKVRVANTAGVNATVTTKHAMFMADTSQANNFDVQTACANSWVDTTSGVVTLREGSSDKRVVAGSSAMAGTMGQAGCKPCLRPDSAPGPSIAGWPWLLLAAAGAAGLGIFLANGDGDTDFGGGTVVVSPTR